MLGEHTKRWRPREERDWALWDEEHPYVPHPRTSATFDQLPIEHQQLWGDHHEGSRAITDASVHIMGMTPYTDKPGDIVQQASEHVPTDETAMTVAEAMLNSLTQEPKGSSQLLSGQSMSDERLAKFQVGSTVRLPLTATFDKNWTDEMADETGEEPQTPIQMASKFAQGKTNFGSSTLAGGNPVVLQFGTATPRLDYGTKYGQNIGKQEAEDAGEPEAAEDYAMPDSGERIVAGDFKVTSSKTVYEKDEYGDETGNKYQLIGLTPVKGGRSTEAVEAHRDWALWDEEHEGERTAEQAAWHADVTDEQAKALKEYTGFGYGMINGVLRNPEEYAGITNPLKIEESTAQGNALHEAMRPMPDDATLYRGIDARMFGLTPSSEIDPATGEAGKPDWQSIVGATVKDNGFVSTSHDESVGRSWDFHGAIAVIHAPAGTPALSTDKSAANMDLKEHEVLLDRGTTFKVTAVDPVGTEHNGYFNQHPLVHMEVVR